MRARRHERVRDTRVLYRALQGSRRQGLRTVSEILLIPLTNRIPQHCKDGKGMGRLDDCGSWITETGVRVLIAEHGGDDLIFFVSGDCSSGTCTEVGEKIQVPEERGGFDRAGYVTGGQQGRQDPFCRIDIRPLTGQHHTPDHCVPDIHVRKFSIGVSERVKK